MRIMSRMRILLMGLVIIVGVFYALIQSTFVQQSVFYPLSYQEPIWRYAREYQVDPYLVVSVIKAESKFSAQARSPKGALGLMQIMPDTGRWVAEQLNIHDYDPASLLNPEINIRFGVWYLSSLNREFQGNEVLILSAYNGGRGNVQEWMQQRNWPRDFNRTDQIPFQETREYVSKVLRDRERYRNLYSQ